MKSRFPHVLLVAVAAGLFAGSGAMVRADDVTDELKLAAEAYEKGEISKAVESLDTARQLMMQKTAEVFAKLFPDAPSKEWTAGEPETSAAGQAMLGGMISAKRSYTHTNGESTLNLSYTAKSPLLQTVMMMYSMPGMMGSTGAKVERVGGQRAIVDLKNGKVQIVFESELLVEVEFETVEWPVVKGLIEKIPWDKLEAVL